MSLERLKDIALSNHDITKLLQGKVNIILYPDIHKYTSIDQLLDNHDACIILYESKPNYGHWTALTRHGDKIEFFNSYGGDKTGLPDASLGLINPKFREKSNQVIPHLKMLMFKSPYELNYNEFQFQKKDYNVKTCGRHCVVRCFYKNMNIYEYKDYLDNLCNHFDTDYDGIVTIMTS
jgi:hypothetical protein